MPFRTTSRSAFFFPVCGVQILSSPQALMLSHPRAQIRDTQILAHRCGQSRSSRPALRNLVSGMLGANIQEGEHDSVRRNPMSSYRERPLNLIAGDGRSCYHGNLQASSQAMGERLRRGPYPCQTDKGANGSSGSKVYRSRKCSEEGVQGTSETTEGCLIRSVDGPAPSDES